jgi:hypothetical protein
MVDDSTMFRVMQQRGRGRRAHARFTPRTAIAIQLKIAELRGRGKMEPEVPRQSGRPVMQADGTPARSAWPRFAKAPCSSSTYRAKAA